MEDAIAEFLGYPIWVQIGLGWFALMAVLMIAGPMFGKARYRRRFNALLRELGADPPKESDWPFKSTLTLDDRPFEISYDYGGGKGYRGPRGHLLITSTLLEVPRWSMHQIDIEKGSSRWTWLGSGKRSSGDAAFDAKFAVISQGSNVREGWLDAPTRDGIRQFFERVPLDGPIWTREGHLRYTMSDPWKGIDAAALRSLLQRQAALAAALERTARGRW